MPWGGWGWIERFMGGIWPGRGPWRHLPPWLRPGWVLGRGWCPLWLTGTVPRLSIRYERELLEEYKRILEEQLRAIDERLRELGSGQTEN